MKNSIFKILKRTFKVEMLFLKDLADIARLQTEIESAITQEFKLQVPVLILTKRKINDVINRYPFSPVDPDENTTKILVTFLSKMSNKEKLDSLSGYVESPDQLITEKKHIYLYCPNGYGKSKLGNGFIEKKLETVATTRNWKTLQVLKKLVNQ